MQPVKVRNVESDFKKAMRWKGDIGAGLTGDPEEKDQSIHVSMSFLISLRSRAVDDETCRRSIKKPLLPNSRPEASAWGAGRINPRGLSETGGPIDEALEYLRNGAEVDQNDEEGTAQDPAAPPSRDVSSLERYLLLQVLSAVSCGKHQ